MSQSFKQTLLERNMLVCVGAGGVGKTTISASLAVAAAREGKRVACLTIDPARRLADSFGVQHREGDGELEDISAILGENRVPGGSLHFGMLDAKATFDHVVTSRSKTADDVQRIMDNKLYKYVSGSLSGMQEYMACERLCTLGESGLFDLIVLDTPPSGNALDFFTAPTRIKNALDGPLLKMMRSVYQKRPGLRSLVAGKWAMSVFGILSKITGTALLDELMEFLDALSGLFGSFFEQATKLEHMLADEQLLVLLVTTPDEASVVETRRLKESLESMAYHVDGVLFNRCHFPRVPMRLDEGLDVPLEESTAMSLQMLNERWNGAHDREYKVMNDVSGSLDWKYSLLAPMLSGSVERVDALDEVWDEMRSLQS